MDESHLQFIAAKRFIIGVVPKVHFVCSFRKNFEIRTRNSCSPQLNLWHLNVRQNISCRCFTQSPATDPLKGQCHEIFDTFICLTDSTSDTRFFEYLRETNKVSKASKHFNLWISAFCKTCFKVTILITTHLAPPQVQSCTMYIRVIFRACARIASGQYGSARAQ